MRAVALLALAFPFAGCGGFPTPVSEERVAPARTLGEDRPLASEGEPDGARPTVAVAQSTRVTVTPAKRPESKRSAAPAVVMAVLAAGGIGSGIAFQVVASSANADAASLSAYITAHHGTCIPNVGGYAYDTCPQLQSKLNEHVTFGDAAVGAFIVGGAAAAGTALYLLWPSLRPKTAGPCRADNVRLTPILGPTGNGLLASGQF